MTWSRESSSYPTEIAVKGVSSKFGMIKNLTSLMLVALAIARVEGIKCEKETEEESPPKLYLYDKQEKENLYTCSQSSIKELRVTAAGMKGTGCCLLFKEENYEDLIHKVGWATPLQGLEEIGVKSVKFIQEDCSHFSMDHDKSVTIVISVCVVAVVILAILGLSLF